MNFFICYKFIIVFVADLFDGFEIIIVFDRVLYEILFVALIDESGKYLFEIFRIRIVFFLIIFKFINESLVDYYC